MVRGWERNDRGAAAIVALRPPPGHARCRSAAMKALAPYFKKRDFRSPASRRAARRAPPRRCSFVIQKHAATRLHYDFRLELDGTLKSWAVPKGPSLDPNDKRMAVHVEDHPIDYAGFEGTIPAGPVRRRHGDRLGPRHLGAGRRRARRLCAPASSSSGSHGEKLHGGWTLVRMHGHATSARSRGC